MGHIGLTPQSVNQIGGYKIQGRSEEAGERLKSEALGLQQAGCFAIVMELFQADLADEITQSLNIPTIGIGSGKNCDGQVLVSHDMLGIGKQPKFVKMYTDFETQMKDAFESYIHDVKTGTFPTGEHEHR